MWKIIIKLKNNKIEIYFENDGIIHEDKFKENKQ
jgi:hypothetical protein